MNLDLTPIGIVHSPHSRPERTPIQPRFARGLSGTAEIEPRFVEGLRDLEGFSHLWLVTWLHRSTGVRLHVTPYLDDTPRGVFATRSPHRPNPIGLSLVRLIRIEGNKLHLEDLDLLDGTPILDIKPHVPDFDRVGEIRCGWYEQVDPATAEARGRRQYRAAGSPGENDD